MDNSQVQRYRNWDSMLDGENEELKKKLSGIDLVDEDESEGQYSERAIDGRYSNQNVSKCCLTTKP